MAGLVGYRKGAWDNATAAQKAFLRLVWDEVKLGEPVWVRIAGQDWLVFHDARISPRKVAIIGWANHQIAQITDSPDFSFVVPEGDDPLTVAADAQGAVNWFTARQGMPAGAVLIDPETGEPYPDPEPDPEQP